MWIRTVRTRCCGDYHTIHKKRSCLRFIWDSTSWCADEVCNFVSVVSSRSRMNGWFSSWSIENGFEKKGRQNGGKRIDQLPEQCVVSVKLYRNPKRCFQKRFARDSSFSHHDIIVRRPARRLVAMVTAKTKGRSDKSIVFAWTSWHGIWYGTKQIDNNW